MSHDDIKINMDYIDDDNEEELDVDAIFAEAKARMTRDVVVYQDPDKLTELFISFYSRPASPFQPGELATWKPALRNRRTPEYGHPCIIMKVLDEPLESEVLNPQGSLCVTDYADLEVGIIDDDGDLFVYLADSHRLMHWEPQL